MSGDEALRVAFRFAVRFAAAEGVTKAAGAGYSRRLAAWADAWMPEAEALCAVEARLDAVDDWIRAVKRWDMAEKSFGMSVRGAREPHQTVPLDPEVLRLHAHLGPPAPGPQINGHGAFAPEGGQ